MGPAHEFMQPAHFGHQVRARAQVEVVGVRKHQLCADFFQLGRGDGFDGGLGAHRGKDGRGDIAVRGVKNTGPGFPCAAVRLKVRRGM